MTTKEEEYDFDNWTEEDDDKALKSLTTVQHVIAGDKFIGRFSDGTIVKLPLNFSLETAKELDSLGEDSIAKFQRLLKLFAGEETAEELEKRPLVAVAILTEKYFRAVNRSQELAFPKL
ncbi:hypothetical protein NCPPB3778_13 [Rathayibacter phage NCPPB3778]|nr:hypothetical protein NCPPB3778_13 [Rathayibacter phage NCPPB3778]